MNVTPPAQLGRSPFLGGASISLPVLFLVSATVYLLLLGGTDAGIVVPAVRSLNAVIAASCVALLPRHLARVDRLDVAAVTALALFAGAGVFSVYPRASFDATLAALAWCCAFLLGRRLAAIPEARRFAITGVGLAGATLSITFALIWAVVWWEWLQATGFAIWPPLTADLPVVTFRHPHVVAFTAVLTAPAVLSLWRVRSLRPVVVGSSAAIIFLSLASGSRTIWLAAVLATAGIIARDGVALLVRHRRTGLALAASLPVVMAIAAVTGLLSSVASRVTTLSTLGARGEIWKASLQLWSLDPLTGSGPGTFALALPSTGYFAANTFAPRHADNALIQALAEGGLLVAVGAILLVWVAMWTAWRRGHRSTLWILIFVVFASITDNPTDTAGLVAATTFWLVVGLPYTPPATSSRFQARTRPHWVTVAATALLVPVASVQIAFGTANFFHHAALAAASDGRWERSEHMVELALVLDPENALYLRELGVLRLTRGDVAAAAQPLTRAASLAPTDEVTQRAYVHAMLELGRPDLAEDALSRAASVHRASTTMLLYEAWFHAASNEGQARSSAAHAVLLSPLIAASPAWEMHGFPSAAESVSVAYGLLRSSPAPPFRLSSQPMWLAALNGVPPTQTDVDGASSVSLIGTSRAFTALLGCRLDDAQRIIVDYQEVEAEQGLYWFVRSLIERATGTDPSTSQQLAMLLEPVRYGAVFWGEVGESPFIGDSQDRGLYHQSSISAHPPALTLPATTDGLRAWMVDPQGTAQRVAPEVNLARCRL